MNKQQQAQALITKFLQEHKALYGSTPTINRFKIKWGMVDVIDSIGYERAKELIEYYFVCKTQHTVEAFLNTFDQLDQAQQEREKDNEHRRKLREQTRERMKHLES